MRLLTTGGKVKAALGVIAVAVVAAGAAPAFADDPTPTLTRPAKSAVYCLQDAPENSALPRYYVTNIYVDVWDNLSAIPAGDIALRYRAHVAHQYWDKNQSQWVVDGDWDSVWGGPTNYVSATDLSYYNPVSTCQNISGYPVGVPDPNSQP